MGYIQMTVIEIVLPAFKIPSCGLPPSGIKAGKPMYAELGTSGIPLSPVTPFSVNEAAVAGGMMQTAFAPDGGLSAVKVLDPVQETTSSFWMVDGKLKGGGL